LQRAGFVLSWHSAVAENQPANKHRVDQQLSSFAARLREHILPENRVPRGSDLRAWDGDLWNSSLRNFDDLALELFALQFKYNPAYRKFCEARKVTPTVVEHWTQIPRVPTSVFKELELTCIPPDERTVVFHSSGTTEQKPSRHFHNAESLAVYEASLWKWFQLHFGDGGELVFLTPTSEVAPRSSLVHMFETMRQKFGLAESAFTGNISADGAWTLDFTATIEKLKSACHSGKPLTLLGTAFSFVHLLDCLAERDLPFRLPKNSRVMETGGYKNRSRTMPKAELHSLVSEWLGVAHENIVCEYGMSELSSQAYDSERRSPARHEGYLAKPAGSEAGAPSGLSRHFHFPPWARAQIISPETGREVAEGETGLIRVFDLANVFSVAAVQTEDLGIRRGDGFELIGRAQLAEPRGCSLMTI
jgi:hypothetical protein